MHFSPRTPSVALLASAILVASATVTPPVNAATWTGFKQGRLQSSPFHGAVHKTFRAIIIAKGSTVAPAIDKLTSSSLNGIDIFYTSNLDKNAEGALSPAEEVELASWLKAGGTLIVTAEKNNSNYAYFIGNLGVSGFSVVPNPLAATVSNAHPLTVNITTVHGYGASTIDVYDDKKSLVLTENQTKPFAIVMEPASGYLDGGRVFIIGDHNIFTNSGSGMTTNDIDQVDNKILATNLVNWADAKCTSDLDCADGDECNGDETCVDNACVAGSAPDCDDDNECTADSCDAEMGCVNENDDSASCDDGDACTMTDGCMAGSCVGADPVVCEAKDECHLAGSCDPKTGMCSDPLADDGSDCPGGSCEDGDCKDGDATGAGAGSGGSGAGGGAPGGNAPSSATTDSSCVYGGHAPSRPGQASLWLFAAGLALAWGRRSVESTRGARG